MPGTAMAGLVSIMPGPSNPIRCSDEMLVRCHEIAAARDLGIHTHLLETRIQRTLAEERYGRTMVAQLDALGILDRRWSLAHTVWVDGDDIDLLAARKAVVVHNPHSNSKIGAGVAPIARMLASGVPVALGTDGASTNDTLSIHEAMSLAAPPAAHSRRAARRLARCGGRLRHGDHGVAPRPSSPAPGSARSRRAPRPTSCSTTSTRRASRRSTIPSSSSSSPSAGGRCARCWWPARWSTGTEIFASADAEAAIRAAKGMRESHAARNRALYRFAEALEAAQQTARRAERAEGVLRYARLRRATQDEGGWVRAADRTPHPE